MKGVPGPGTHSFVDPSTVKKKEMRFIVKMDLEGGGKPRIKKTRKETAGGTKKGSQT